VHRGVDAGGMRGCSIVLLLGVAADRSAVARSFLQVTSSLDAAGAVVGSFEQRQRVRVAGWQK
jgi:hypothetical protein